MFETDPTPNHAATGPCCTFRPVELDMTSRKQLKTNQVEYYGDF